MKALPLEKQVASLGLMQELVGLGVKVEGLFWYFEGMNQHFCKPEVTIGCSVSSGYSENIQCGGLAPALTVAELGELLPRMTWSGKGFDVSDGFFCGWDMSEETESKSEADARAKMLIWLIRNDKVTIEELNSAK